MPKNSYKVLRDYSNQARETNDCAVVATAVVCRTDYFTAHALLKKFGRKDRDGTRFTEVTKPAIESLGFKLTPVKRNYQKNGSRYTPITAAERFTNGYYLCQIKGHIFAIANGRVCDWTEKRRHRIVFIWKVTKTREVRYND